MNRLTRITTALAAVPMLIGSAGLAVAGTKFQTNIVPSSTTSPPGNPTVSTKGKFQLDDKGKIQAIVKGATDAVGDPVTTSTVVKDSGAVDATSYVAIVRGTFTALAVSFELPLPMDLKKGNGTGKFDGAALFAIIPGGLGRSVEVNGVEVWGPVGAANVTACNDEITAGFSATPNDPACRGGSKIGVGGINIP